MFSMADAEHFEYVAWQQNAGLLISATVLVLAEQESAADWVIFYQTGDVILLLLPHFNNSVLGLLDTGVIAF